ncbi:pentapeptide repeat-containing protein [Pleionea sp. CnH1-48]|uniref:pentapeptide repeat-containing protein n=1 Tax=Pleionea sp. CnH1-48 TaxID=2954494 RepID=UPI0020978419|nr:pentapeptide repeat-containing protein [Pleionea sp. CnH1-48]MCO7226385.1 pentapeptide repeat-containing protein [Pleionea sp. CnH1-48]
MQLELANQVDDSTAETSLSEKTKNYACRDFSNVSFVSQQLDGTDFSFCQLEGANFAQASLKNCRFFCANLEGADLKDALFLNEEQFSGANLAYCQLPDDISFTAIESAEKNADDLRRNFLTVALMCLYSWLAIGSTTDVDLLLNESTVFFPLIEMSLPTVGFYYVAPLLLFIVSFAFNIQLTNYWKKVSLLPSIFPDGTKVISKVNASIFGKLIEAYSPFLRATSRRKSSEKLKVVIATFLIFSATPVTLLCYWFSFLKRHDWIGSSLHLILLSIIVLHTFYLLALIKNHFKTRSKIHVGYSFTIPCFILVASLSLITIANCFYQIPYPFNANIDVRNEVLSQRLENTNDKDNELVKQKSVNISHLNLKFASFRKSTLQGSDIVDSDLEFSILQHADFSYSNLAKSILSNTKMEHIKLGNVIANRARFVNASMPFAVMSDGDFHLADFRSARLTGAKMSNSHLSRADMTEAALDFVTANKADFSMAIMRHITMNQAQANQANFYLADLKDAHVWKTTMNQSRFILARLHRSNFTHSSFNQADFSQADFNQALFIDTNARQAIFYSSKLLHTDFSNADLKGAHFAGAQIQKSSFSGADLSGADFSGAWFDEVNLCGANLTSAKGLTIAQLKHSYIDAKTRLPNSLAVQLGLQRSSSCTID